MFANLSGRIGLPLGVLLLLVLQVTPVAEAQAGHVAVELPRGRIYQLLPSAAPVAVSIPLQLRTLAALRNLRAVVLETTRDAHVDDTLNDAFKFDFRRGPRRAPLLTVRASAPRALEQGTYTLQMAIFSTRGRRHVAERIRLTLIVPAAVLRQPQPQAVTSTVWFPWDDANAEQTLTLHETADRSWLADVTIVDGDTGRATDQLVKTEPLDSLPRGGAAALKVRLSGNYPVGDTRGSFELSAPQLASPVTVEYTLTKRVQPLWIVLLALAGAGLGTFTRVIVVRYSARRKASEQAMALLNDLRARTPGTTDPQLRAAFEQQSQSLARALALERDGEILLRTVAQVETDMRLALERHLENTDKARAALSEKRKLVDMDWRVPASVAVRLADARSRVEAAAQALYHDDATTANLRLNEVAELVTPSDLRDAASAWRDTTRDFAHWTKDNLVLPPEIDTNELDRQRKALLAALEDSSVWAASDSTARTVLIGLQRAGQLRQDVAQEATDDVQAAIAAAIAAARDGDGESERLAPRTDEINAAWREGGIDHPLDDLKGALRRGLAATRRAGQQAQMTNAAAGARPTPTVAITTPSAAAPAPTVAIPPPVPAPGQGDDDGKDATRWSRAKQGVVASVMWIARTFSTMILVAIAALVLFRGTWVGTFDQIVAVFLWGYGLNLSATTLVEIATRSPSSTPSAGAA